MMNIRSFTAAALAVAAALLTLPAAAQDDYKAALASPGTLTIATTGNAPPMTQIGPDGQLAGFDIALCAKIADKLGLSPKFVRVDFAATIPGLKAKRFDMICSAVARTPARLESQDLFMSEPTIENFTTLVVKKGGAITAVADARNRRVGVVRGGQEGKLLEELFGSEITISSYPGIAEELLDLKNGRIDAVAMNFTTASHHVATTPEFLVVTPGFVKEGVSPYTHGLVVSRGQPALLQAVNAQIKKMQGDGSLDALKAEWISAH
ncbi:substrate-binding periplasmic protein [Microvirga zambiensis]|uniref:substrate-binding periplasmic protein n=1 Tax=Microvirga zambiensis TaxID=1402137 RepID=UPI001FEC4984|nr:transporter substrate-binding domain-containing protein [Microvirga zambiensis]